MPANQFFQDDSGTILAAFPSSIFPIILHYADNQSKQRVNELLDPVSPCPLPLYERHVPQSIRSLLPRQAAGELVWNQNIPQFMEKHYSIRPGGPVIRPKEIITLANACYSLLYGSIHFEASDSPVQINDDLFKKLQSEDANRSRMNSCLVPALSLCIILDLLILFGRVDADWFGMVIRVWSGIVVPGASFLCFIEYLSVYRYDFDIAHTDSLDAPEAYIGSFREFVFELHNDYYSPRAKYLNMAERALRTQYSPYRWAENGAFICSLFCCLYDITVHPELFTFNLLNGISVLVQNEGPSNVIGALGLYAIFAGWGTLVGFLFHNPDLQEWVETNTYVTPNYNRAVAAMDLANLALIFTILLIKGVGSLVEKTQQTCPTLTFSWNRGRRERAEDVEAGWEIRVLM